ncbi:MAG TPA: cytochrome c-type biogenesis protein [Anaerolineales bacterium]|nr:cytochrome c-type biogenesis protein [Anaerolineales bacterium]
MQNLRTKLTILLLTFLASLLIVSVVYAQDGGPGTPSDNDVNRVAKQIYCPVCPNTPLDVCETKACENWRAQIRDQLAEGWTDQQVIDYFVAQYGERVLAEPQRKGFTSLVWFLPLIAVLVGLGVVYEILRNWRKQEPALAAGPAPNIPEAIRQRIERELQEMD